MCSESSPYPQPWPGRISVIFPNSAMCCIHVLGKVLSAPNSSIQGHSSKASHALIPWELPGAYFNYAGTVLASPLQPLAQAWTWHFTSCLPGLLPFSILWAVPALPAYLTLKCWFTQGTPPKYQQGPISDRLPGPVPPCGRLTSLLCAPEASDVS